MLPNYHFSPTKHKWTVHLHLLLGIALPAWLKLLWRHARHIDWRTYWHRVVFLTLNSIVTSLIGAVEHLLYGPQIASQLLHESPVFILGHPRTGTTHLHNLLSRDPRFAYCNTFQSGFPSTFLLLERFKRWLYLPPTRPMDAMALHW